MKTIQTYTLSLYSSTTLMLLKGSRVLGVGFLKDMVQLYIMEPSLENERVDRIFTTIQGSTPFEEETELMKLAYIGTVNTTLNTLFHVFEIQW
jgi:hypothetical protein